jgi:hypothetical protein
MRTAQATGDGPFQTRGDGRGLVAGGAAAGLLGAAAMIAVIVVSGLVSGFGVGFALEPLWASFGEGPAAVLAGLAQLAIVAAVLGIVFAWILPPRFPTTGAVVVGVGYGLVLMSLAASLLMPAQMRDGMALMGGSWVIAHAVLGALLGLAPALRRRFSRRAARPAADDAPRAGVRREAPA